MSRLTRCGRCGATTDSQSELVIAPDDLFCASVPTITTATWAAYCTEESAVYVCPDCLTATERAELLFGEVDSNVSQALRLPLERLFELYDEETA
jgi:hypothetical protein